MKLHRKGKCNTQQRHMQGLGRKVGGVFQWYVHCLLCLQAVLQLMCHTGGMQVDVIVRPQLDPMDLEALSGWLIDLKAQSGQCTREFETARNWLKQARTLASMHFCT